MPDKAYQRLATRLDELPNGFPPTADGAELRLLAKIFSPEEADLAARLGNELETPEQIAIRLKAEEGLDIPPEELQQALKGMARKGLILAGRAESGLAFRIMPFVVGIYEAQVGRLDAEMAQLFEAYYQQAFTQTLSIQPAFHRVIPVNETVRMDMEVQPYESASDLVAQAQAWGVLDCICRKQKALIGDPCEHPIDVCMALGHRPGVFDKNPVIHAVTQEQAIETLHRAAKAGLVHTVSNSQAEISYICNCCTCSCGILRGMSEMGMANVVARSAFVNQVDESLCLGCEICQSYCQFDALHLVEYVAQVDQNRCVGCGVCVPACPEGALGLVRRPEEEILPTPGNHQEWNLERAQYRQMGTD